MDKQRNQPYALPTAAEPPKRQRVAWIIIIVVAIVVFLLIVLVAAYAVLRPPQKTTPSPSPRETKVENPFAEKPTYVNPFKEGVASEENPFYVNPFKQYREGGLDKNAPIKNPFGTPAP